MQYFPSVESIRYEGPTSQNPLSYKYYDANKEIMGKTLEEHLRIAICFWHSFCFDGRDAFGDPTMPHSWLQGKPMEVAFKRLDAGFEFFQKMGIKYFTFHNLDVSPEADSLKKTMEHLKQVAEKMQEKMVETNTQLLWGTTNLTRHPRYLAGAFTNPDANIAAYALTQVKQMMDHSSARWT